jgi:hypothetical protein
MLTVGIARRSKLLRVMALALLGLTIFKVFLFDLSSLEKLYRIITKCLRILNDLQRIAKTLSIVQLANRATEQARHL